MASRSSQQDHDGTVWTPVALPLGTRGLDLRRADNPADLSELLNARFLDDRTVKRRDGHEGRLIQTQPFAETAGFPEDAFRVTDDWVYGHGTRVVLLGNDNVETAYYPIHTRGGGTFEFEGSDVVWTGDRLLVVSENGPLYGNSPSTAWGADGFRGIQAYLPVQTDAIHPDPVDGEVMDVVVTDTLRIVANSTLADTLEVRVFNRATGALLRTQVLSNLAIAELRCINSAGTPVVVWIEDGTDLKISHWDGDSWTPSSTVQAGIDTFDVAATQSGFLIVWRDGSVVKLGTYQGFTARSTPFAFGMTVTTTGATPNGSVTVAVSPSGDIAIAWNGQDGGGHEKVWVRFFTPTMTADSSAAIMLTEADDHALHLITLVYRGLRRTNGRHALYVFGGTTNTVHSWLAFANGGGSPSSASADVPRYNAALASKAFRVGHEVFCWYHSLNSSTNYLVGGEGRGICGIADREEAVLNTAWVPSMAAEPNDPYQFHWCRRRQLGNYIQVGNVRVGTLKFLNPLSTAQYGRSVYVAGSLVRNWDGLELGDAGFHDYPVVGSHAVSTSGGALTSGELYQWRVYPVRYNAKGERFQGAAFTYSVTLGASDVKVTLTIDTMPCTNHDTVEYEVYRTPGGGGAFRYEGKVSHTFTAPTVSFESTSADSGIATNTADPYETGVAGNDLLEGFGPIGCSTLIAAADRLWGFGGQVPAGTVQFSKLFTVNEGAGFDAIAGTQIMDAQGGTITSLACFNDATIIAFEIDRMYILNGSGPDNYGIGGFSIPQVVIADGALDHRGTIGLPGGVAFWGTGGPRMLDPGGRVTNISEPVAPLAVTLSPSGVRVDRARNEVVWYTETGDALLWNYSSGSRWARWSGLKIAGCSPSALITTAGRYLRQVEGVDHDDGRRFTFKLATGNIRPEQLLAGNTLLQRFGMVGKFIADHRARFRIYYDGSPLWYQSIKWVPASDTWLTAGTDFANLTPAQIDALGTVDRSGSYSTHHRAKKQSCQFFRLEVSDMGSDGFIPWEFAFVLGGKPGLARTPVNNFE